MAFGCAVARLGQSPQEKVRDSRVNGLGAGPVTTVHPVACPWGFNTANRKPTLLEQAEHTLCLMAQDVTNAAGSFGARARNWWHSLWSNLQSAAQSVGRVIASVAQAIWDGVKSLWSWFYNTFVLPASLLPWLLVIGAGLFVISEAKTDFSTTKEVSKHIPAVIPV